jgi:hypothetical protein
MNNRNRQDEHLPLLTLENSFERSSRISFRGIIVSSRGAIGMTHASARWTGVRDAIGRIFIFSMNEKLFPRSAKDWIFSVPSNTSC